MPHVPAAPPADRFFARIDKFECECPSCGRLISSALDKRNPTRATAEARQLQARTNKRIWDSVWNPHSQRLACPWCRKSFVAGLLLYPVKPHGGRPLDAPPDVALTSRELAVMRQRAQGWYVRQLYRAGQHVNQAVMTPCSCPEPGWSVTCPLHGDPDELEVPPVRG
jgi:hypothetical protein